MILEKEKTAVPNMSVGADKEQPISKKPIEIVAEKFSFVNDFDENSYEKIKRQQRIMSDPTYLETLSMNELYENIYHSKPPIIDGLLYAGTYLFAGAPKVGKSFLMAQIAYHISTGIPLWNYPVSKGTVLYLALEDDYKRLQNRLFRMFGTDSTEKLRFSTSSKYLNNGLEEQLQRFVNENTDTKLIIIDTLQKIRESGNDKFSYANDYEIISKLKQFADRNHICLLLVHHTRKQQSDDKFEMISGTTGLLGSADGAFLLQKEKRTSNNATLDISGRDQQDQCLYLKRDTERLIWELEKAETELYVAPPNLIIEKVSAIVSVDTPNWSGTATELVSVLGLDIAPNKLTSHLNVEADKLLNDYNICYENSRNHAGRNIKLTLDISET